MTNFVKESDYKKLHEEVCKLDKKIIILAQALTDVRSELTSKNSDIDWCVDKICIALNKVEKKGENHE